MNQAEHTPRDSASAEANRVDAELSWMHEAEAQDDVLAAVNACVRRRRRRWLGVAASLVVLGVSVVGVSWFGRQAPSDAGQSITAAPTATVLAPEIRTLPDGSTIALREGAQVTVDYSGTLRQVILQRGEAHFQVAKNKERPFVVIAAGIEARALGTAFSVDLRSGAVEVLVAEGRVAVDEGASPHSTPPENRPPLAVVDAGNRVLVPTSAAEKRPDDGGRAAVAVEKVSTSQIASRLAWRVPRLEFSRTPLAEVVELMNRHAAEVSPVTFVIADDKLRGVKLSGFLRADNVDGFIELLATNFGITADRSSDSRVLLRRAR